MPYARLVEVAVLAYEPGGPGAVHVVVTYFMESNPQNVLVKDAGVIDITDIGATVTGIATAGSFQWR